MTSWLGPFVALLFVVATVAPVAGGVTAQEETSTPSTNETDVRHVDPDEVDRNGDLVGLQSTLARRMTERLAGSSIQLSQGQYELADQLIGEAYQDQYGKYVEIAGETDEAETRETFERARERQGGLNEAVERYWNTRNEYREAKRTGNEQRARQLARELDRIADNVSTVGSQVTQTYTGLSNQTGVDMANATAAVNRTVRNVTAQQAEIRQTEFIATNLTLTPRSELASFAAPLVLDGRLTTENGSTVANRIILLDIDGRRVVTRTDGTGEFAARYRPVIHSTGPATATVRYLPNETSIYLGAETRTSFVVEQVASTVTIESATDRARFNESVVVSGRVEAADEAVPTVPVVLVANGQRLARANTIADGAFTLRGRLPAAVPAGTHTLRVVVPLEGQAIASSNATRRLTVAKTATKLTLRTDPTSTSIEVAGRLQTTDGDIVSNQQVEIRRNGSVVTIARTGSDGSYTATVLGESAARYRVTVRYAEPGTNLEDASASRVVTLPPAQDVTDGPSNGVGPFGDLGSVPELLNVLVENAVLVAGGLLLVLLTVGGGWWMVRDDTDPTPAVTPTKSPTEPAEPRPAPTDPLAPARDSLDETPDAAVERAYRTVRQHLHDQGFGSTDATHWEFFRACETAGIDRVDALETLTLLYERAAFDLTGVATTDAETALEVAAQLVH